MAETGIWFLLSISIIVTSVILFPVYWSSLSRLFKLVSVPSAILLFVLSCDRTNTCEQCFEEPSPSPEDLVSSSDYIAMGRLVSRSVVGSWHTSTRDSADSCVLMEAVYVIDSTVKGQVDSIAFWDIEGTPADLSKTRISSSELISGKVVNSAEDAVQRIWGGYWWREYQPIHPHGVLMQLGEYLEKRSKQIPVMTSVWGPDLRGKFGDWRIFFNDVDGSSTWLLRKNYWKKLQTLGKQSGI